MTETISFVVPFLIFSLAFAAFRGRICVFLWIIALVIDIEQVLVLIAFSSMIYCYVCVTCWFLFLVCCFWYESLCQFIKLDFLRRFIFYWIVFISWFAYRRFLHFHFLIYWKQIFWWKDWCIHVLPQFLLIIGNKTVFPFPRFHCNWLIIQIVVEFL